ncbi:hypothetical protein ABPG74_011618 [Tetrahymena malaccensis]
MSIIHRILDVLIFIGDEEEQIEVLKFEAFQQKNFSIAVAFMRIDQQQKGFIKACDLQDFLSSNGYHSNGNASLKYVSHYDLDGDEQLTLKEFERALLPQSSALLKQDIIKRPGYNVIKKLPIKLEEKLFLIIKRQIQFYHKLLTKLSMIWVDFKLDLEQIFQFLDANQAGYINAQGLYQIFQEFGYTLYKDQIQFIMQKFDLNLNGVITQKDFCNLLQISSEIAEDMLVNQQSIYEIKSENRFSNRNQRSLTQQGESPGSSLKQEQNSHQNRFNQQQEKRIDSLNNTNTSRKRINSLNKPGSSNFNNLSVSYQIHLNDTFSYAKKRCISSNRACQKKSDYQKIINKDLIQFLKFLVEYAKRISHIDSLKQQLLSQPDIDATVIFSLFDKHQRGFLGQDDFTEGMYNIGLIPNNIELMVLFRRFRLEQDMLQISFSEFAHIICPSNPHLISNIYQKFDSYTDQKYEYLSYTSQTLLRDYFSAEIENQMYKYQFTQNIQNTQFTERDLISTISKISPLHQGIITLRDIEKQLKLNGFICSIKYIQKLFEILNQKQQEDSQKQLQVQNYIQIQIIVDEILYE